MAGLLTGIIKYFFKISDLLSGILVAFMLYSVNFHIMGGKPNLIVSQSFFYEKSSLVIIFFIVFFIVSFITYLFRTDFGLSMISVGENHLLAKNMGVNIKFITLFVLGLSNALIAFSGALVANYQEFCDINGGIGTIVIGLAALMIGEKILPKYPFLGCVVGSLIYRIFISIAMHNEVLMLETYDINLLTGILIIIIMGFSWKKENVND